MSLQDEFEQEVRDFKSFLDMKDAARTVEPDVYGVVHRSTQHLESPTRFSSVEKKNEKRGDNTPFLCGGVGHCNMPINLVLSGLVTFPSDNGTYSVPFDSLTFVTGAEQCFWKLTLSSGDLVTITYHFVFEPAPWEVQVGGNFDGGATVGSDGILGSPITNAISGADAGATAILNF